MKIKSIRSSVHRFQVTIPLIDKPIEERKVVVCRVETDDGIVGCGLPDHASISLADLLGDAPPMDAVMDEVVKQFGKVFECEIRERIA